MENITIHDNHVLRYVVDLEKKEIILTTKTEGNELIEIVFKEVTAYFFDNTIMGCIIFSIDEIDAKDLIKDLGDEYIIEHKNYGWPFDFKDIKDLKDNIVKNGIRIYSIASSYGMSGFVLAKAKEILIIKNHCHVLKAEWSGGEAE